MQVLLQRFICLCRRRPLELGLLTRKQSQTNLFRILPGTYMYWPAFRYRYEYVRTSHTCFCRVSPCYPFSLLLLPFLGPIKNFWVPRRSATAHFCLRHDWPWFQLGEEKRRRRSGHETKNWSSKHLLYSYFRTQMLKQ